jgi:hypothetical protein
MSGEYRARGGDWAEQEKWEPDDGYARCLLELRSRVEALDQRCKDEPPTLQEAQANKVHHEAELAGLEAWRRQHLIQTREVVADQPEPPTLVTDDDLRDVFDEGPGTVVDGFRALYDLGRQHGARAAATEADNATAATVAEIRSSLFKDAAQPEPAPDAPAAPKGLPKERLARIIEPGDLLGGLTLRDVVEWLREQLDAPETAAALEKEATQ